MRKYVKSTTRPHRIKIGHPKELSVAWNAFRLRLPNRTFRNAMMTFVYYTCRLGFEPDDVSDPLVDDYISYLEDHQREAATAIANSTVKYWNQVRTKNLQALSYRKNAKTQREDELNSLDAQLRCEIESFVKTRRCSSQTRDHERNSFYRVARTCRQSR